MADGLQNFAKRLPSLLWYLKGAKAMPEPRQLPAIPLPLAQDKHLISGILAQYGVAEATDFKQMLDVCRAFSYAPDIQHHTKGRVAILTFSGGAGIMAADFLEQHGLELAKLSEKTSKKT